MAYNPTAAAIYAADIRSAETLANRAYEYAVALMASGGKHRALQLRYRAELIRAMQAVVQTDDLNDALETAEAECVEVQMVPRPVDTTDETTFPTIAEACRHARQLREQGSAQ